MAVIHAQGGAERGDVDLFVYGRANDRARNPAPRVGAQNEFRPARGNDDGGGLAAGGKELRAPRHSGPGPCGAPRTTEQERPF